MSRYFQPKILIVSLLNLFRFCFGNEGKDNLTDTVSISTEPGISFTSVLHKTFLLSEDPCYIGQDCIIAVLLPSIFPDLKLTVKFDDNSNPIHRDSLSFALGAFPNRTGYGCMLKHRYSEAGEYLVEATLTNTKSESNISYIPPLRTTIRIKCSVPRLNVTRLHVNKSEQSSRNETLVFHVKIHQDCTSRPVTFEWDIFIVDPMKATDNISFVGNEVEDSETELKVSPYALHFGSYYLKVVAKVPYRNHQNYLEVTGFSWFKIVSVLPEAVIIGPTIAEHGESVAFNASKSFDPDANPSDGFPSLTYTWYCLPGQWQLSRIKKMVSISFSGFEDCLYEECACQNSTIGGSNLSFVMWPHHDHYRQAIPTMYTIVLRLQSGTRKSFASRFLMFRSKSHSQVTVSMHLIQKEPDIEIACLSNCLEYVEHSKPFVLYAHCRDCLPEESLVYEWEFFPGSNNFSLQTINWDSDTIGGNRKPRLVIPECTFGNITDNESYQFIVTVTRPSGKRAMAGFSCYFARYGIRYKKPDASEERSSTNAQKNKMLILVSVMLCLFCHFF